MSKLLVQKKQEIERYCPSGHYPTPVRAPSGLAQSDPDDVIASGPQTPAAPVDPSCPCGLPFVRCCSRRVVSCVCPRPSSASSRHCGTRDAPPAPRLASARPPPRPSSHAGASWAPPTAKAAAWWGQAGGGAGEAPGQGTTWMEGQAALHVSLEGLPLVLSCLCLWLCVQVGRRPRQWPRDAAARGRHHECVGLP